MILKNFVHCISHYFSRLTFSRYMSFFSPRIPIPITLNSVVLSPSFLWARAASRTLFGLGGSVLRDTGRDFRRTSPTLGLAGVCPVLRLGLWVWGTQTAETGPAITLTPGRGLSTWLNADELAELALCSGFAFAESLHCRVTAFPSFVCPHFFQSPGSLV